MDQMSLKRKIVAESRLEAITQDGPGWVSWMCSGVCVREKEQAGRTVTEAQGNALEPGTGDGSGKGRTEEEEISFLKFIVDSKLVDHSDLT